MNPTERVERLREALGVALSPEHLKIIDDSHQHAGHASARGGGHYTIEIVSQAFRDKGPVQRHQMVYAAVEELMQSGEVHALSINAKAPEERA